MSKLFENSWKEGFEYFERYYDTELNTSIKKQISLPFEWFEPSTNGKYTSILDESIKLEKKQGKSTGAWGNYGMIDPMYRNIRDTYWNEKLYNKNPRIWYLDIETRVGTVSKGFPVPDKANEPISLMQIYDNVEDTMIVLGIREWKHQSDYKFDFDVKYIQCDDEVHLLDTYLQIFKKLDPLIVYAWNGNNFDFPYIYNRLKKLGFETNKLSNHGTSTIKETDFKGQKTYKLTSGGHFYIDLMDVYKKFTLKPVSSYALDNIAKIELGQSKVNHSEYAAFDDFYSGKYIIPINPTDSQKNSQIYKEAKNGNFDEVRELAHSEFVYYGIIDAFLIRKIDKKNNFTDLQNQIAEKMGVLLGDAMGTVKPWSQFLANTAMLNMQVMPPKDNYDLPSIVGGYVRTPNKGKHKWVISVDVNSMYPLLGMVASNMSPETFVSKKDLPPAVRDIILTYFNDQDESRILEDNIYDDVFKQLSPMLKQHNLSLGINGAIFKNDKVGIIPNLVLDIYKTRKTAKKTQFDYEKRKILIEEILKSR